MKEYAVEEVYDDSTYPCCGGVSEMHVDGRTPGITIYLAQAKAECPIALISKVRKKRKDRRGKIKLDYTSILDS